MKEFAGKVAVITGAASGIGRALAEHCAQEGMKVVLADVETDALLKAEAELSALGTTVLSVLTDVSQAKSVANLANRAFEKFGAVHLLFNNAGVGGGGSIWDTTLEDWDWVLGVNLWGVIHGVREFVPKMLAQGAEGYIINTASVAGLLSAPGLGAYNVSKHGVVTLSETLWHELNQMGANVKVSVLCPGFVKTRILESHRNRPAGTPPVYADSAVRGAILKGMETAISPAQVAKTVFEALREERFYILTHLHYNATIRQRMEAILHENPPSNLHEQ